MTADPSIWGFHIKTPAVLAILVVTLLAGTSCSVRQGDAATTPDSASRNASDRSNTAPEARPEDAAGTDGVEAEEPVDPDQAYAEYLFLPIAEPIVEDEVPGEELTESPLDELGLVTPELTPEEIERERQLAAAAPPEFDIPMEINDKVLAFVDYYSNRQRDFLEASLVRSGKYVDMFREIFAEAGIPQDLVYMAHVESGYKTSAYSRARAKGIFQFISATGRRYGLKVDYWVDERSDPEKSARAAAAYLADLYDEFGDWYLALAGYNAGEGKVRRALARTRNKDFWSISRTRYIRRETKNYVPAILASILITKEPAKYGLSFQPEPRIGYDTIEVDGAADLRILAKCAGSDFDTLKALNPALRRNQTPPYAKTDLRVPVGAGKKTLVALAEVPKNERVLYARHKVREGDTLGRIAREYGVTVSAIQQANNMGRSTLIRVNRVLTIPTAAAGNYTPSSVAQNYTTGEVIDYRVRRGDTLYGIARRYGTTSATIAAASKIHVNDVLSIGQRLKVTPGVRSAAQARGLVEGNVPTANGKVHTPSKDESAQTHTVRRGDSLWRIAKQYDTTIDALCALNRISRNVTLHPGTRLSVRR
jgi:membrane-bound lytic murein transglycosylase D